MKDAKKENPHDAQSAQDEANVGLEKTLNAFIEDAKGLISQSTVQHDKGYTKPENVLSIVSIVLTAIAAAFAGGAYHAAKNQAKADWIAASASQAQAATAQQALIAENRPWLKVTIVPTDLIWLPGTTFGGMVPLVEVQNVGHSVALHAQAVDSAYLVGSVDTLDQAQKKACAFLFNNNVRGNVLFPGDSLELSHESVGAVGFGFDQVRIEKLPADIIPDKKSFSFVVYGCVDYTFGNSNTHFQTFFAYQAWRILKRPHQPSGVTGEFMVGQSVPSANILFTPTFAGNYAN